MNTLLIQGYTDHKLSRKYINIIEYYMNEIDRGLLHITKDIYIEMITNNKVISFKWQGGLDAIMINPNRNDKHDIVWKYIVYELSPSEDFLLEFANEIGWKIISISYRISQDFILKYFDKLDHITVYYFNRNPPKKILDCVNKYKCDICYHGRIRRNRRRI